MAAFRALLLALWLCIATYTAIVVANWGFDLFPIFFGDIAKMGWPGQFNLDFTSLLTLSALWVAWRHDFSGAGLGLALLAFFGGGFFLTAYLLVLSVRTKGDITELLLGRRRAAGKMHA